jgi:glycolate oxidase iron-sulfur subunit
MAEAATRGGFEGLDPCVHCGFCLPACPTYLATGDESDSPRGRIVLMRALERGDIPPDDPALREHLDACLGCRGCEPVCPSGVAYGRGLEAARERLVRANGMSPRARAMLGVFRARWRWEVVLRLASAFRASGIPSLLAGTGPTRFALGMLAASGAGRRGRGADGQRGRRAEGQTVRGAEGPFGAATAAAPLPVRPTATLFEGCVMSTLFRRINDATRRVLEANGYEVTTVRGQTCCGALHEHAGDRGAARELVAQNVAVLDGAAGCIVVTSAGCGAILKDAGHLVESAAAARVASRVRDVSELLAEAGPRRGAALALDVVYDAPCHLQHAQRVHAAPLQVLESIPGLQVRQLPGADRCCGSAGIFSLLEPEMSRAVLAEKIQSIVEAEPRPALIVTGNPGCLMQIGAGLRAARLDIGVAHPVELLDWSYRAAGLYG